MRRGLAIWALALTLAVIGTGCSAINDFGRFMFGDEADGGMGDAGMVDGGMVDGGQRDSGTPDAGTRDGGQADGGGDAGADGGAEPPPTGAVQTAGSAILENSEYRLRISVGAPQPAGSASDSSHRLRVGPVPR